MCVCVCVCVCVCLYIYIYIYIYITFVLTRTPSPRYLRKQKLSPLFKSGNKSDPSNFRPISVLPILSKPLEKQQQQHINEHVMKHFLVNDSFYQKQSGFRPNHSCHTALTELIDTWLSEININKLCGASFIDFAKVFDVINHDLLLRKLTLYSP